MVFSWRCFLWHSCTAHLATSSANKCGGPQSGGAANLHLAVCPSAACSPPCSAKVPHTIAVAASCPAAVSSNVISWPRLLRPSPVRHAFTCGGSRLGVFQGVVANLVLCKNQVSNGQPAFRRPAGTFASGRMFAHHARGVQACHRQASSSKANLACVHRPVLLAPA